MMVWACGCVLVWLLSTVLLIMVILLSFRFHCNFVNFLTCMRRYFVFCFDKLYNTHHLIAYDRQKYEKIPNCLSVDLFHSVNVHNFQEYFFKLRDLTEKARAAYADLVSSVEKELADEMSDEDSVIGHSRSPSTHSIQSRTCSEPEPEPCSDCWPLLDNIAASRGYSSETEAQRIDAVDDSDDENIPESECSVLQHGDAKCIDWSSTPHWCWRCLPRLCSLRC